MHTFDYLLCKYICRCRSRSRRKRRCSWPPALSSSQSQLPSLAMRYFCRPRRRPMTMIERRREEDREDHFERGARRFFPSSRSSEGEGEGKGAVGACAATALSTKSPVTLSSYPMHATGVVVMIAASSSSSRE